MSPEMKEKVVGTCWVVLGVLLIPTMLSLALGTMFLFLRWAAGNPW